MKTREERLARQEELLRVRDAVKGRLMGLPGVRSVGVGLKEVGGRTTDQIVLRIYVDEKKPVSEVPPKDRIPAEIDGIPTDVIVWELDETTDDSGRYRPLRGGIQISNGKKTGTLGCFARRSSDGVWVALGNHHVMFGGYDNAATDIRIAQPETGCCCCCVTGYVARVVAGVRGGTVDCAIATLDSGIGRVHDIIDIGTVDGTDVGVVGDIVRKRGRTSFTTGKIKEVGVDSTDEEGVTLTDQILIEPAAGVPDFQLPGDSGAALVNEDNEVVGLMCRRRGHNGIGNPIAHVESALGISIPVADGGTFAAPRLLPMDEPPTGGRVRDWERLLLAEAQFDHPLAQLIGRHRQEVWDLIQHNREVGVRWQRGQGPAFVAAYERTTRQVGYRVPGEIAGVSRAELLLSMAAALDRNGSAGLRADLREEAIGWIPRLQRCETADALWREYQVLSHEYRVRNG